ncbi:hypothetical protein GCM10011534_38580 [Pseudooceanicola nanhaiensis]|jgi:hypothetical protein|uniref:Tripartite-type tricarboxylate transporter, receptor component TctC n=1 Tax=Pseudooceanicola nanhaiensis TaxID=375761 RepID=A0A917T743_9RHOB|nr:hypothetical protein [Pseudooceanicola nanhaiensis]GGM12817.1 hypothetical protein GCM10011534_38580 [Pseudooceanicola nanhaiensis]
MRQKIFAALAMASAFAIPNVAAAQEADFSGKTVRIVQNFAAGGSTDLFARTLAPFVAKYLPGEPTVVVEPRPGAAGIQAATYMHNSSRPDGLEICLCNSIPTRWVTLKDFELDVRDFGIAGSQPVNTVVLIRNDLGVEVPADLADTPKPLLFSAPSPADLNGNRFNVFAEMFGARSRIIGGFGAAGNNLQSVLTGETTITSLNGDYYAVQQDSVEEAGTVHAFGQVGIPGPDGFVRDASIDAPTFDELIREYKPDALDTPQYKLFSAFNQAAAVQFIYLLAPGTPEAYVQAWETALSKAVADPEYAAAVEQMEATVRPFSDTAETREKLEALHDGFKAPEVVEILMELAPAYFK